MTTQPASDVSPATLGGDELYPLLCGHTSDTMCPQCGICAPCLDDARVDLAECEHGEYGNPPRICRTCQQCLDCALENPPR